MPIDETDRFHVRTILVLLHLRRDSTADWEIRLVGKQNGLPEPIFIFPFVVNKVFGWATCQWVQSLVAHAALNPLVASVDFSPGFLEDADPNLISSRRSAEAPPVLGCIIRQPVINDDNVLFSTNVEIDCVTACLINEVVDEDILNALGILSQRGETRQKVAVAALSLLDIAWVDVVVQREVALTVDFRGPFPHKVAPRIDAASLRQTLVENARQVGREVRVFEWLLALDCRFVVDRRESGLVPGEFGHFRRIRHKIRAVDGNAR